MADPNTRTGKRTPVTLKIKFKSETLEQFIERYAVDVSQGGIFIRTKEPLAVGTQMRFEFQLRDASPLIGGEGTVVWTRENDPSRPAIAPGMGVRFDRLAEGSQSVLERILSEKAKQAPTRGNAEPTKPPMFTDQPTRVASLPMQEQLLGLEMKSRRRAEDSYNDQHTPLPKPMPFHSDADEFPDEAFEEATKVRALDELVAQTADPTAAAAAGPGEDLSPPVDPLPPARRSPLPTPPPMPAATGRPAFNDLESAPGLPSPPEAGPPPKPGRLLDTSPSPRIEAPPPTPPPQAQVFGQGIDPIGAKTRLGLGLEAPRMQSPSAVGMPNPGATLPGPGPAPGMGPGQGPSMGGPMSIPPGGGSIKDLPTRPSGIRAVAAESTAPVRMTAPRKGAGAAIAILILVVLAAGAAGVWFFFLREKAVENAANPAGSGSDKIATGSGSNKVEAGGGSNKVEAGSGSNKVEVKAPMVDTVVDSLVPKSSVEIVGTDQRGDAPFTAKLEKDKPYKARVMAVGYATLELDLVGGGPKQTASLVLKPRMLSLKTEPTGALISIDNVYNGKITPLEVELTKAQVAKKSVRIRLVKTGYKTIEKVVQLDAFTEDADRMIATVDEKLNVQQAVRPPPDRGSGSQTGSAATGSGTTEGSGTPPGPGSATVPAGSAVAPPPPEPEPEISKP